MSFDFSWSALQTVGVAALVASAASIVVTVALVRLYGLRSLAKFAAHDFVATVAMGSVIAATAARSVPLPFGLAALGSIFVVQGAISWIRLRGGTAVVDNDPILLMVGDRVLWDNMDTGEVTVDDLRSKLREANVLQLDQIRAVVLEGTGDIAVLHSDETSLDPVLIDGIRGLDGVDQPAEWQTRRREHDPFVRP